LEHDGGHCRVRAACREAPDKFGIGYFRFSTSPRVDGALADVFPIRDEQGAELYYTAQIGKRLVWAEVMAVGPNVRSMEPGDQVLFSPEDRYEVEVRGDDYIILRERDVHAVAAERLSEGSTGLYL